MARDLSRLATLREDIVNVLKETPGPIQLIDLSKRLRIRSESDDYEYLRHVLNTMADEGIVSRQSRRRFALAERPSEGFTGTLHIYHEAASVTTDDADFPTIIIKRQNLANALDGDIVLVRPLAIREGKKVRGEVVRVLERSATPISGTIEFDGSFYYLIPDEAKHLVDFLIAEKNLNGAKPGDKVLGAFVRWEHENASPEASITEVLGKSGTANVEFEAILKEFRLPASFPPSIEEEAAAALPPPATGKAPVGRTDLRKTVVVTIDPDDARDFDDALSLRQTSAGHVELGVHIADVSHYVNEGTALDREALKRGNSTYLVDRVVPMLPEHLSNNICSLVPNKPRFTFSVFMEFSPTGTLRSYRIEESIIKSTRRFTYGEVQEILDGADGDHADLLRDLHKLSRILNKQRMKSGGVDFETQEIKFLLDEHKQPITAVVKSRTDATSLVEECMLAANRTVAEHLKTLQKQWKTKELPPYVYRIHEEPEPDKLADAVAVIRALGLQVPSRKLGPTDLNAILTQAKDRADKQVIHSLLLRSMSKAVYAEFNVGHYGLGFREYAHFTSPIRRYPDLYVHRALKEYAKGQPTDTRWKEMLALAGRVADHTSLTERASVDAERASNKLAQVILCREHLGEEHDGIITGVTNFGIFVMVKQFMVEGLVHIRDLTDDYYFFDEKRYRLVGKRSHRTFQFGTEIRIKIVKANVEKRTIDFMLMKSPVPAGEPAPQRPQREQEQRSSKRGRQPSAATPRAAKPSAPSQAPSEKKAATPRTTTTPKNAKGATNRPVSKKTSEGKKRSGREEGKRRGREK